MAETTLCVCCGKQPASFEEVLKPHDAFCTYACHKRYHAKRATKKLAVINNTAGQEAYVMDVEAILKVNNNFREVLQTTPGVAQKVVMTITPEDGEIGTERHADSTQFIKIESGTGRVYIEGLGTFDVQGGSDFQVRGGLEHNLVNLSATEPLKLYSIYMPPHHPPGTVHRRRIDAIAAEKESS